MARLSKADERTLEEYGLVFAEPPPKDNRRRSRYDDLWESARELCRKFPGRSLKVRVHNNSSAAYQEATAINNGEKKVFANDFAEWRAVAGNSTDENEVYAEGHKKAGEPLTAVYLTYIGPQDGESE